MFVVYLLSITLLMSCSNNVISNTGYDIIVAPPDVREQAVWYAKKYIEAGAQYGWGGQDPLPKLLIDCSGLVIRCYEYATNDLGYSLLFDDTTSSGLKRYTKELSLDELCSGDILFMGEDDIISHVALFVKIENDKIVFIDSTYKPEEGINGVSERSYLKTDPRFISFGRMLIGKRK